MEYRTLGRTGLRVSEIALGCEGFVERDDAFAEEMFRIALEGGVNCMDLYTPKPDVHRRVGRAIGGRRCRDICARSGRTGSTRPAGTWTRCAGALRACWKI